ncbi:MAG: 4Fe-4S binding protein [Oscillospiraceae bacterium]|nr:4Fe-4S binding protein [Oscillospiraceae bacterium]
MKMKNVWAVYWSATGSTKKIVTYLARALSKQLGCPYASAEFTLPRQREADLIFAPQDLVLFGTPVYAGRVPNVLLPYLREKLRGNGALAVPVVLYGNRNFDDGLIELRDLLEQDGFRTVAGGAFIGEHSFSRTLAAGRPDGRDFLAADQFVQRIASKISRLGQAPGKPVLVAGKTPVRPYYTPRDRERRPVDIRKVQPKTSEQCTHCGLCASVCPMGSIDPNNIRILIGICIKCCACVKKCPVGAKYFEDPAFLYHKTELEEEFSRRAEPSLFV